MTKKAVVTNIFLLLAGITAFSQIYFGDTVRWHPVSTHYIKNGLDTQKVYYLTFDGSTELNSWLLPVYTKVFPVKSYAKAKVTLLDVTLQPYDTVIFGQEFVADTLNIEAQVALSRRQPYLRLRFVPLVNKNGRLYRVTAFKVRIDLFPVQRKSVRKFKANSVLRAGRWVKIGIPAPGVYKITYDKLRELGFSNPQQVRVFGNDFGQLPYDNSAYAPDDLNENKVFYASDYLLFYAEGPARWYYDTAAGMMLPVTHDYSDTAYYFLTDYDTGFDNNMDLVSDESNSPDVETDLSLVYGVFDQNDYNVLHSGRIWFALPLLDYQSSQDYGFSVKNIVSKPGKARITFVGRSEVNSVLTASCCGYSSSVQVPALYGDVIWGFYRELNLDFVPDAGDTLVFTLTYNGVVSSAKALVDKIIFNAYRKLYYSGITSVTDPALTAQGQTVKFKLYNVPSGAMVWDITNPVRPFRLPLHIEGQEAWFVANTDTLRRFVVFSPEDALSPVFDGEGLGRIDNQNLHAISANTDMIIVTHKNFVESAEQLAELHRRFDGLNVQVVTVDRIYNEYSSGMRDVVAIRNFLRSVYEKPGSTLRWVLLFGDGSYRNKPARNNPLYVPTYQTLNSLNDNGFLSFVSDDFYAMFDPDEGDITPSNYGLTDVNIGRLPVKSVQEARDAVRKIEYYLYHQDKLPWKRYVVFIADDGSQNIFMNDAENVSLNVYNKNPEFQVKKIYLDAYRASINFGGEEYPGAVIDIKNRVEDGSLIIGYLGHGNETVLTSERVITISDVRNWKNLTRLNFFITGTCEFGRFDMYSWYQMEVSAGEEVVLNPVGGAIALLTTTRLSYSSVNFYINYGVFDHAFDRDSSGKITLGEIIRRTKRDYSSYYVHEFVLLGDPALKLTYPVNNVVVTNITPDTLKALSEVRLEGKVVDTAGNIIPDFNGDLYLTVFAKPGYYWTLNNDGVGAFRYLDYKNIIFNGKVSVTSGQFNADFIVPKDIDIETGQSKIIFYAADPDDEAIGSQMIIVGGKKDTVINDTEGPRIKLYLNDTMFVNGSITNDHPEVLAYLYDQTGINTMAAGLGHELRLILDDRQFIVNDYFVADKNTYKSGVLKYKLYKLSPGKHTLTLRAFDVLNNYSEKTIEFYVTDDAQVELNNVFNYPNPFVNNTAFYFEHNQAGQPMVAMIQIFTVSGRLVKTLVRDVTSDGFFAGPIYWDGRDTYGQPVARGVYFYILTVKTGDGKTAKFTGKLLKI